MFVSLDSTRQDSEEGEQTNRETNSTDKVPNANMPTQDVRSGDIPLLLGLNGEEEALRMRALAEDVSLGSVDNILLDGIPTNHEETAADDLRHPENSIGQALAHMIDDTGQTRKAGDPEDGGPDQLGHGGEKSQFTHVVRPQLVPGWQPGEGAPAGGDGLLTAAQEGPPVHMVVLTGVVIGLQDIQELVGLVAEHALQGPAKAARGIFIDSFEHQ